MDDIFSIAPHLYQEDRSLLESLGIAEVPKLEIDGDHFEFGTVTIRAADEDRGDPATTIKIEGLWHPSVWWWRLTVTRPKDEIGTHPPEVLKLSTGSGKLTTYWPTAMMVANNMLTITQEN